MSAPPVWLQFICKACGLVYDEALGDPDSGLPAGTRFADIPDDWCCPLCGVTKADFEPHVALEVPSARDARASRAEPARAPAREAGVVIVGAGRAGWQMAQALRAQDAGLPITLVTACSGDVYDKPLLSVACARGLDPQAMVRETGVDAARRLGVRLMPHTHAVRVDAARRRLRTTRGTLAYCDLVLAHGAVARLPAALPASQCWRINQLSAYQGLRRALGQAARDVAIIGAGLVGCELADDLARGGHRVLLLDAQPRPLAAWLPEAASEKLLAAWATLPLDFVGGVEVADVAKIEAGDGSARSRRRLACRDGRSFDVDEVVVAAGLETPGRLARTAGLPWANGIAVNPSTLDTGVPHVHALGDCISLNGRPLRFIEPIARQAQAIASRIGTGTMPVCPTSAPVLRVKTGSMAITLQGGPATAGHWVVESELPDRLTMVRRQGPEVVGRLTASRTA